MLQELYDYLITCFDYIILSSLMRNVHTQRQLIKLLELEDVVKRGEVRAVISEEVRDAVTRDDVMDMINDAID